MGNENWHDILLQVIHNLICKNREASSPFVPNSTKVHPFRITSMSPRWLSELKLITMTRDATTNIAQAQQTMCSYHGVVCPSLAYMWTVVLPIPYLFAAGIIFLFAYLYQIFSYLWCLF